MQSTHDRCLCTTDVTQTATHKVKSPSRQRSVHRIENGPSSDLKSATWQANHPAQTRIRSCRQCSMYQRDHCASMKSGHTSWKTPADTKCCRRCQTKPANHQTSRSPREASCAEPRICTPPGTTTTSSVNQKKTEMNAWERMSTHEHNSQTR